MLQRRLPAREVHCTQVYVRRSPAAPAQFVADAVQHGLAQVSPERAHALCLDMVESSERLREGVLDQIVRVRHLPCPFRQAASSPSLQRGQMAGEESLERLEVTGAGAGQQLPGRVEGHISRGNNAGFRGILPPTHVAGCPVFLGPTSREMRAGIRTLLTTSGGAA